VTATSPPARTPAEREAALARAAHARRVRADLKAEVAAGQLSLAQVFQQADEDDVVANIKLLTVLEAVPNIGKIRSRRLLAELDISERRRLRGVGVRQRTRLLERLP
jgi:hypothetical protein